MKHAQSLLNRQPWVHCNESTLQCKAPGWPIPSAVKLTVAGARARMPTPLPDMQGGTIIAPIIAAKASPHDKLQ
jgi:hypothetical protein